jgi:hypothetical protein
LLAATISAAWEAFSATGHSASGAKGWPSSDRAAFGATAKLPIASDATRKKPLEYEGPSREMGLITIAFIRLLIEFNLIHFHYLL